MAVRAVLIGLVLVAVSCLLPAPSWAQRDKMSLGEALGAQVIRATAPIAQPAPVVQAPKADSLKTSETFTGIKNPK